MSDHKRASDLVRSADELWPVGPALTGPLTEWIRDARELRARLPRHEAVLRRLEGAGQRDRAADEDWRARNEAREAELRRQRERVRELEAEMLVASGAGESPTARELGREHWVWARRDLERLEEELLPRPAPVLSPDDAWQYESTRDLIHQIERVNDPEGILGRIQRRLELATTLESESIGSPEARERWRVALASISDVERCPQYAGLHLDPILGLLPIGRNPETGLWEFTHLASGDEVVRDGAGQLVVTEASGIVLVLLPGGNATLGSQDLEPSLPHYLPYADVFFERHRACELEPFLVAAFETTQAQWRRMTGEDRSEFAFSDLHPVDNVSWNDCGEWLVRYGLRLPTRDEWEYAARGGRTTRWASGMEVESTRLYANLLDQTALRRAGLRKGTPAEAWTDGFGQTAPVGSFLPNDFGLYDTLGNLQEWLDSDRMRVGACWVQVAEAGQLGKFQTSSADARDQVGTVRVAMSLPGRAIEEGAVAVAAGPAAAVGPPSEAWSGDPTGSGATLMGSASTGAGLVGDAFDLDGTDAWVDLGVDAGDFGDRDFTVELWVRPQGVSHQVVVEKYVEAFSEPASTGWALVLQRGDRFEFKCREAVRGVDLVSRQITPDRWYHVAFVREGSWHRLYLDGGLSAEVRSHVYDLSSRSTCRIGRRGGPADTEGSTDERGFYFDGLVDELAFYDRALTAEEVGAIHRAGASGKRAEE